MGNEIVYCGRCQTRLLAAEFERGKAVWHEGKPYCAACLRELASALPPDVAQRLLEQLAIRRAGDAVVPETPRRGTPRKTSTARIPVVKTERRTLPPGSAESSPIVPIAIGAAVLVILVGGAALIAGGSGPARRPIEAPVPARPAYEPRAESPPVPRPAPAPEPVPENPTARREDAARRTLEKARAYVRSNAADLPGQITLYEEAGWECRGTPLAAEATREREAILQKRAAQVAAELAPLAEKARASVAASRYAEALALLQKETARLPGTDWTSAVDQKILQIRSEAEKAFADQRQKALQSRRRGDEKNVQAVVTLVTSWGLEEFSRDLSAALAAEPPPARPLAPDVRAYLDAWEAAFGLARGRDYGGAARALEAAAAAVRDPALKAESATDVETLRLLSAAFAEVQQGLLKAPKGAKVSLEVEVGGSPARVEGAVARQGPGWIEVKTDADAAVTVELDDLTAVSLRELLGKMPGRKADADARIGVLFPLLEGDAVDLSGLPSGAVSPRIAAFGARVAQERARPDVSAKEGEARTRFETAERQYGDPATRLESFETYRTLVTTYAECVVVRRKHAVLAQRLDAEKDAGKEYVLFADQMQAGGSFRRAAQPKAALCWTSTMDLPPEKENFVEFTFAARAGLEYRCWVEVGACCAETFAFDIQGTEMGADPGSPNRIPVKNSINFLKKTHAAHGGRKEPTRFEWVAVPLPKYASAGPKTVRVLSGQQGFSVAVAVVSASRTGAPSDQQLKEWERSRPAVQTAGDPSLVAWWTLDEGGGTKASDSSGNRLNGVLRSSPVWTSGKRRGALSFNGQSDYVEIPKDPKLYLQGAFTVAAWVNPELLPKSEWGMYVVSDYSLDGARCTYSLRVMSSGAVQFFWQTDPEERSIAMSAGRIAPGAWAHLAGVWDGKVRTVYINGVADGTNRDPQPRPDIGGNSAIGRPGSCGILYFSGRIDDVRIYSRALSSAEVRALAAR